MEKEILDRVEEMQNEMHSFTEELMNNSPKVQYQDAVVIYMLHKLATIQTILTIRGLYN